MSLTNETTRKILKFLFDAGIFAYRNSVGGGAASYTAKDGSIRNRFVQFGKSGSPDIIAITRPHGTFVGCEIKTGKDRIRPEQEGFKRNLELMGGVYLIVKDYEDFIQQWTSLKKPGR